MRDISHFLWEFEEAHDFRNQFVDRGTTSKSLKRLERWEHQLIEGRNVLFHSVVMP